MYRHLLKVQARACTQGSTASFDAQTATLNCCKRLLLLIQMFGPCNTKASMQDILQHFWLC